MAVIIDGGGVDTSTLLQKTNNLSDLPDVSTARTNLGLGTAATADTGDFDAAGAAAAAIAALGGADGTVTDEQLRNWAGQALALMTSVTRTDYSKSWIGTDGRTKYAGSIHVTGTVTWPDGVTGHLDGVEYPESPGVLQYFTASHVASGKIVVQSPLVDGAAGVTIITPDYYVDSSAAAGGDGSLASPFDTLADLPLDSGDVIALKSGSAFKETIYQASDINVGLYRYGTGAKPIIDGSDAAVNASFSKSGGLTNVYQIALTLPFVIDNGVRVYENDVALTPVTSTANCDSTAGSYYVTAHSGSITLYIHAIDSSDVTANGKIYEYTARRAVLVYGALVIDGIDCRRALTGSGALAIGAGSTARHCDVSGGVKHLAQAGQNCNLYGIVADDCVQIAAVTSSATVYNLYENTPDAGAETNLYDCALKDKVIASTVSPWNGHSAPGQPDFTSVTVSRFYIGTGYAGSPINYVITQTFDKCYARSGCLDIPTAVTAGGGTMTVSGCVFDTGSAAQQWLTAVSANGMATIIFEDNYFAMRGTTGSTGFFRYDIVVPLIMRRNVLECFLSVGTRNGIYNNTANSSLTITDNVFANTVGTWFQYVIGSSHSGTFKSNRNIFRSAVGISWKGSGYTTLATWQAVVAQDLLSDVE